MKYSAKMTGFILAAALAASQGFAEDAAPQSLAQQLESAVYAEDVLGNLEQAKVLYQRIIDAGNSNRQVAARAMLRLGQCQLKEGDGTAASQTFARIKANYSDMQDILDSVGNLENAQSEDRLALSPVPWHDGEALEYGLYDMNGHPVLYETHIMKHAGVVESEVVWKKQIINLLTSVKGTRYSEMLIGENGNAMISQYSKSLNDDGVFIKAKDNQVIIDNKITKNTLTGTRDADALDELAILETLRRLPYHAEYKETFKVFSPNLLNHLQANIEVLSDHAEITVPAGKYDTYQIRVDWIYQNQKVNEAELWFSKGPGAKLIQQVQQGNVLKLIEESSLAESKDKLFTFKDQFTLELPGSWKIYDLSNKSGNNMLLVLTPIEAQKVASQVMANAEEAVDWKKEGIELVAKWNVDWAEGYHQDFIVREDTRKKFTIQGLPAYSYIADFKAGSFNRIEYRIIVLDAPMVYQAFFHVNKEDVDEIKPQIDAILASLKVISKR